MNTRKLALGGVAALALALAASQHVGAETSAQPAPQATSSMPGTSSQDGGLYGSQVNSPQVFFAGGEVAETKKLNEQASTGRRPHRPC
jgi:hypothetical protein